MSQHTPGPWAVGPVHQREAIRVIDPHGSTLAWCGAPQRVSNEGSHTIDGEQRANARLIAAAPDLLDLAEQMLAVASVEMSSDLIAAADAVIRKARGEA
jgi:hypothetical protein